MPPVRRKHPKTRRVSHLPKRGAIKFVRGKRYQYLPHGGHPTKHTWQRSPITGYEGGALVDHLKKAAKIAGIVATLGSLGVGAYKATHRPHVNQPNPYPNFQWPHDTYANELPINAAVEYPDRSAAKGLREFGWKLSHLTGNPVAGLPFITSGYANDPSYGGGDIHPGLKHFGHLMAGNGVTEGDHRTFHHLLNCSQCQATKKGGTIWEKIKKVAPFVLPTLALAGGAYYGNRKYQDVQQKTHGIAPSVLVNHLIKGKKGKKLY